MPTKIKFALIVVVSLWASAFVGIRAGLEEYSPEGLALMRYLVASICMGIIYYRMPERATMHFKDVCALMGIGVLGIGIYNLALNYGELSVPSGMANFITSQAPIITTALAVVFLGERTNLLCVMGLFVSLFGVSLIALGEGGFSWDHSIFYIFLATAAAGFYSALQKPFLKRYHAIEATTYIIWGATLFLAIYIPQLQHDLVHASLKGTLTVIYLGVFPAAIAYLAWSYILAKIPASQAVSFLYSMPFIATLLGWYYLGEAPMLLSIFGGVFAIMGVWLVNRSYRMVRQ